MSALMLVLFSSFFARYQRDTFTDEKLLQEREASTKQRVETIVSIEQQWTWADSAPNARPTC